MKNSFKSNIKLPKIGIRPIIDGRCNGVREENEKPTRDYAELLKKVIEENIFYPNGEKVECVIANSNIGNYAENAKCKQQFMDENVGVSISITPCWCYGWETIDITPNTPKAIIGVNGTERPGAVYLAAAAAAHEQLGEPVFTIYGKEVKDKSNLEFDNDVLQKIYRFVKSALAVAIMKNNAYLAIGGTSMGIAGSKVVNDFFTDYLNMQVEVIDMSEIQRRVKLSIYDENEYKKATEWVRKYCKEGVDYNASEKQQDRKQKCEAWEHSIKMSLIFKDLMQGNPMLEKIGYSEEALGHNAICGGFQGQRQWTDFMSNGDFAETILNSSFDWNGVKSPIPFGTENDSLNVVCMLFGFLLTGKAQQFSDIRTYWSAEAIKRVSKYNLTGIAKESGGVIHLCNSGSTALDYTGESMNGKEHLVKQYWTMTENDTLRCLEATKWCAGLVEYFRGGGWSSQFTTKYKMPVTMSRINWVKGLGAAIQIIEGWTVELPGNVEKIITNRTNPSWPTAWFVPKQIPNSPLSDSYYIMNNWFANHGAISHGHIGADLITLASMLRIPVSMHNVEVEEVFRPKVWGAFGTSCLEGADLEACRTFGPLYKKF